MSDEKDINSDSCQITNTRLYDGKHDTADIINDRNGISAQDTKDMRVNESTDVAYVANNSKTNATISTVNVSIGTTYNNTKNVGEIHDTIDTSRFHLCKKIGELVQIRDNYLHQIKTTQESLLNIEAHTYGFLNMFSVATDEHDLHKYIRIQPVGLKHHTLDFPFFIKNSKYVLAIFNTGIPTKYPVKGPKLPNIFYTVGYVSKRMFFKHRHHPQFDNNYIIYTCSTYYEGRYLMFDIKTDDGFNVFGDSKRVMCELRECFDFPIEFETIEEFCGLAYDEVVMFIKSRFDFSGRNVQCNINTICNG